MEKVSLAKKTARLMVDKLSPQELENELYHLLIMLPDNDLDYAYEDVKKGEVAGEPIITNPKFHKDLPLNTGDLGTEQRVNDEVDKIISKLYKEETTTFENYLEGSDLVKEVDIDSMSGVINIYWHSVDMGGYITQATPFWADIDDIPIQVETSDGVLIDNGGVPVNVHFHTSEYIEEGFLQFMRAYYDKLPEIFEKSKDIVDRYEGFQIDRYKELEYSQEDLDKALEKWSSKGAKSLTREEKDLIYNSQSVHTDYGWHELVREFLKRMPKKYRNSSLDEIPYNVFEHLSDESEQHGAFVNEYSNGEYRVEDYYDKDLKMKDFNDWEGHKMGPY